jgi:hypothetical protein
MHHIQRYGDQINGVLSITTNMAVAAADVIHNSPLKGGRDPDSGQKMIDYIRRQGDPDRGGINGRAAKAPELAVDCLKERTRLFQYEPAAGCGVRRLRATS